ncbi:ATP-binding protein [Actinoplanes sp. CA-142083]|uniref:ATP-binding protein n=1 Tax=Actinoplanes sp. CA-142083 TaxID=3239903 RepID=UPI003D8DA594
MPETTRAPRLRGNLPAELSSFVDRVGERAALKRLLTAARLVTVTGVGGVGKTRTTLRVAAEVQRAFADGAWFVDLSALARADLVVEAVGQSLGLRDQSTRPQVEILAEYLAGRRLLLVLDNCEHLAESCAELIDSLLRAAPGLRVLTTSRQPLGVQGEHVFPLPPLPVDDAAVTLFVERARASAPGFALTDADQDAVDRLCRGLDGIPLAIELAAVRTRALPVRQIADLLDDRFTLLSRGGAGIGGRHESLRTAIDWSYGLCTRAEGLLWARLSVFAGQFDLAAAQQVGADGELAGANIVRLVAGLVDKSILLCETHAAGASYRLLDTIREYGLELLLKTGEERRLRRRHRDFYLELARRFDAEWCGPDQIAWYLRLSREHSNIRAALDFSLSDPAEQEAGLEMAAALVYFWIACGHCREGRHYLDLALGLDQAPSPALTKALWVCAWVAQSQGDETAAKARVAQCRPLAAAQADTTAAGWIAYLESADATLHGDPVLAVALAEESVDRHRNGGDLGTGLLAGLAAQSIALAFAGEFDREIAIAEETRQLSDERGAGWMRSYADYLRALGEVGRGAPGVAVRYARDALRFKRQLGDSAGCAMAVDVLATAAATLGEAERAVRLLGVSQRIWETVGLPQLGSAGMTATRALVEEQARAKLGDRGFDAALADGLGLDREAGIEYALDEPSTPPAVPPPAGWAPLTRREHEVAVLIAEGLTNQQIAERLVIGRRTANTHVEHILTKLDFTSRAQIAVWATERQLLDD